MLSYPIAGPLLFRTLEQSNSHSFVSRLNVLGPWQTHRLSTISPLLLYKTYPQYDSQVKVISLNVLGPWQVHMPLTRPALFTTVEQSKTGMQAPLSSTGKHLSI